MVVELTDKLTIAQAARLLDVNYNRVVYAIAKGWLHPIETPFGQLLRREDVERYGRERGVTQ